MKKISIVAIPILLLLLIAYSLRPRTDVANNITSKKIKSIISGMTLHQAESILGRPYRIKALVGLHNIGCKNPNPMMDMQVENNTDIKAEFERVYNDTNYCCEGNKEDKEVRRMTLVYTKPVSIAWSYPMLLLGLNDDFTVGIIGVNQYDVFGFDHHEIYAKGEQFTRINNTALNNFFN